MKDQVDALCNRGVKAANLDSTLTTEKASWVKNEVLSGGLKILYVAPERLGAQQGKWETHELRSSMFTDSIMKDSSP